jgi:hypothetical protein
MTRVAPSRPPTSVAEAADLHLRLVREFNQPWFRYYMRGFWETYYDDNRGVAPIAAVNALSGKVHEVALPEYLEASFESLTHHVGHAETVFVTKDICHVVETMSKGMPEDMLLAGDVPFDDMLLFFETDIDWYEWDKDHWTPKAIRAVHIAKNEPVRSWGGPPKPGVVITLFTAIDSMAAELAPRADLVVTDTTGWQFEQMWETAKEVVDVRNQPPDAHNISPHVAAMRKFLLTLLRFMNEEIVAYSRQPMTRAQRRRAQRQEGFHIPDDGCITTIHLRRLRHVGRADPAEPHSEIEWSHRWWVQGFWRHLDYLEPGRVTWVRPHIRGPEWLPLVMKQRVTVVER